MRMCGASGGSERSQAKATPCERDRLPYPASRGGHGGRPRSARGGMAEPCIFRGSRGAHLIEVAAGSMLVRADRAWQERGRERYPTREVSVRPRESATLQRLARFFCVVGWRCSHRARHFRRRRPMAGRGRLVFRQRITVHVRTRTDQNSNERTALLPTNRSGLPAAPGTVATGTVATGRRSGTVARRPPEARGRWNLCAPPAQTLR